MINPASSKRLSGSSLSTEAAAAIIAAASQINRGRAPSDWQQRIPLLFPDYFWHGWSAPHEAIFAWAQAIGPDSHPRPFVAIWPRGRGKSTTAEAIAADLGIRQARTYCMYVCGTQDQADKHVATIARMLESEAVTRYYPDMGRPKLGKNGSRTWNRRILTTASGYTVEAVGLNKAVRGQKIDWARPDLIIFDDVDDKNDSEKVTDKNEGVITGSILPAGAINTAVLFVQNLIRDDSIAARLARPSGAPQAAQYLMDRIVSGPFPAVEGLEYDAVADGEAVRWQITAGRSLWTGFDLAICEEEINRSGPSAFMLESQHEIDADNPNALLSEGDFNRTRVSECPELDQIAVAVDPPASTGQCGIVAGGKAKVKGEWHGYTLSDDTTDPGEKPNTWAEAVLACYYRLQADFIVCEVNNGGDMVESTIRNAKLRDAEGRVLVDGQTVKINQERASRGKITRAQPVAVLFEQGRAHHVGHFPLLEKQWRTYEPGDDSPDRLDAEVWLYAGLGLSKRTETIQKVAIPRSRGLYGSRDKYRRGR